jgi:hypothetical protein
MKTSDDAAFALGDKQFLGTKVGVVATLCFPMIHVTPPAGVRRIEDGDNTFFITRPKGPIRDS